MQEELNKRLDTFGQRALSTRSTVQNTFDLAKKCIEAGVEGDFVECGVFAGTQIAAMALANQHFQAGKKIHLFDSFEGIPQAGPEDDETITSCIGKGDGKGALVTTGVSIATVSQVQQHMREWKIDFEQLVFHVGWFQDSIPVAVKEKKIEKISLLRLDGDLYESTKVCLEGLHPMVQIGGYVIIDDYALTGCRKAVQEYWDLMEMHPEIVIVEDGGGPVYYKVGK